MADEQRRRVGTCCCGNLKAETVGEPFVVSVCSCIDCQRRTGSAFNTVTYWDKSKVSLSGDAQCFVRERPDGRNSHIIFVQSAGLLSIGIRLAALDRSVLHTEPLPTKACPGLSPQSGKNESIRGSRFQSSGTMRKTAPLPSYPHEQRLASLYQPTAGKDM
jgi:hypothetical protein